MLKPRLRIFLDSNVIISGLRDDGPPSQIIKLFIQGDIKVVVSQFVLEEVIRTLKEKFPKVLSDLNSMLVNAPPEIVASPNADDVNRWEGRISLGDAAILAAAVASQPDFLVTGDNHFLKNACLKRELEFKIVTPTGFLALYIKAIL